MKYCLFFIITFVSSLLLAGETGDTNGFIVDPTKTEIKFEYVNGLGSRNTINVSIGGLVVHGLVGSRITSFTIGKLIPDYPRGTVEPSELFYIYKSFEATVEEAIKKNKRVLFNPYMDPLDRVRIID